MRYAFIKEHRGQWAVSLIAQVLAVAVSGFYDWLKRGKSKRAKEDARSGEQVTPTGLSFSITVARYRLKREMRVVVATFFAAGRVISRWGKRRWRIEAFFKTAKGRFGLARFGQGTLTGMYRFLVLSLLAFVLFQWEVWSLPQNCWPAWQEVAMTVRRVLMPELVHSELLAEFERLRPYLETEGLP